MSRKRKTVANPEVTPPDDPAPPRPGLQCPSCACCDLRVYYTRPRRGGVLRVRICRHCGRRIVTHETA